MEVDGELARSPAGPKGDAAGAVRYSEAAGSPLRTHLRRADHGPSLADGRSAHSRPLRPGLAGGSHAINESSSSSAPGWPDGPGSQTAAPEGEHGEVAIRGRAADTPSRPEDNPYVHIAQCPEAIER